MILGYVITGHVTTGHVISHYGVVLVPMMGHVIDQSISHVIGLMIAHMIAHAIGDPPLEQILLLASYDPSLGAHVTRQ